MTADGVCSRARHRTVPSLAAGLLLVGCTYSDREPGLLNPEIPRPTAGPSSSAATESSTAEPPRPLVTISLPVAGEAVWTSADGLDVQVRIAVHAVRRVDGGTVLDWSVTPIRAPHRRPGDPLPDQLDLGLSPRWESSADIVLVDPGAGWVYRPLARAAGPDYCLCTPVWLAQRHLRLGVTTVLQVAFPSLPASARSVEVDIATVSPFALVPVTAAGRVPVASRAIDLARPAPAATRGPLSRMFRYGPSRQVFRIRADRVVANETTTSLEWTIIAVTGGDGMDAASGPPFARPDARAITGHNPVAASGPKLRVRGDRAIGSRVMSNRLGPGRGDECLCTDLRSLAGALRHPDTSAGVVTSYPPLPRDTRQVEVVFDGLDPLVLPVTRATSPPATTDQATPRSLWRLRPDDPQQGWSSTEWPTPVPSPARFAGYAASVDVLR